MMTIKPAHHIYTYSRMTCNNGSLKISSNSWRTSCSTLIQCRSKHQIITIIEYYILKFRVSLCPIKRMMTIKPAHHIYIYSRMTCNNGSLKISSISLTTSCSILIQCRSRHQIITIIEYYHILKFRVSLYLIEKNDDY